MGKCCICHFPLLAGREGFDHIGFESARVGRVMFICQTCLDAITYQVEYGLSYQYASY